MMTNLFLSFLGISASISLIVAVLILLTSFLNKRYAAKWKYLIWIFLALRLLVPFSGADGGSVSDVLPQLKAQTAPESREKYTAAPAAAAAPTRRVIVEIPAQMTAPIAIQSEGSNISITLLDIVAFAWMTGSLIFISVHFISYLHCRRQVMKRGAMIRDIRVSHQIFELKCELHISRAIPAIKYSEAGSPMIIGFLKPVLVLPEVQYGPEELFFILKHELVHLKRGDIYFKLLFVAANAVHWFNPLIWIMQKEAAVDMELSCDERVTRGIGYDARKAYTETLFSMLHKQCTRKTVLSTQFYGGKKIMKKRFKNILSKKDKKNGIAILIGAVILTISLGTRVGCAIAKEDAGAVPERSGNGDISLKQVAAGASSAGDNALAPDGPGEQMPAADHFADNNASEDTTPNTITLTFLKEGEEEQKQAALVTGEGYSLYLPDGEWRQSDSDQWTAVVNEQVMLWITHFEGTALKESEEELLDDGYVTVQNYNLRKQEGEQIYNVGLKEFENDVWGVFYCYPAEAEEGWGRELPVVADTFAVSVSADDGQS